MRGDRHVGRPLGDRVVDDARVDLLQVVRVVAALARLRQFLLRAEVGPHGVVELQVAAAGVVERLDRLAVGLAEILEERVEVGIDLFRDRLAAAAEMQHRRRRDRHLRRSPARVALLLQELEMLQHRMVVRKVELADDADARRAGSGRRRTGCPRRGETVRSRRGAEEIEMPPGAAELAVGRELQADRGLLLHDLFDLAVLDLAQVVGRDFARLELGARLLDARRPQQAADFIGAERGFALLSRIRFLRLQDSNFNAVRGAGTPRKRSSVAGSAFKRGAGRIMHDRAALQDHSAVGELRESFARSARR